MTETSVVLATFNGEKYIAEFLDSLVAQSYRDFDLIVSDDGSTDRTVSIVESFQDRLSISISGNQSNLGPALNFSRATEMAAGRFVAFADQDDTWHPDKLALMIDIMKSCPTDNPALVFCDLEIVNDDLGRISKSFFVDGKSSECRHIGDFLFCNHIPGCAMVVNRALLTLGLPVPARFRMHDWWFALTAAAFGTIIFLNRPLVCYRQHGGNLIGAQFKAQEKLTSRLLRLAITPNLVVAKRVNAIRYLADTASNTFAVFTSRYSGLLRDNELKTVRAFESRRFIFSRLRIVARAKIADSKINALLASLILKPSNSSIGR